MANGGSSQLLNFCTFLVPGELDIGTTSPACAQGLSPVDCQITEILLLYGHVTWEKKYMFISEKCNLGISYVPNACICVSLGATESLRAEYAMPLVSNFSPSTGGGKWQMGKEQAVI